MCIVCALHEKGKITRQEARKAFEEIMQTETFDSPELDHINETLDGFWVLDTIDAVVDETTKELEPMAEVDKND